MATLRMNRPQSVSRAGLFTFQDHPWCDEATRNPRRHFVPPHLRAVNPISVHARHFFRAQSDTLGAAPRTPGRGGEWNRERESGGVVCVWELGKDAADAAGMEANSAGAYAFGECAGVPSEKSAVAVHRSAHRVDDQAPGHRSDRGLAPVGETSGCHHGGVPKRGGNREASGVPAQIAGRNRELALSLPPTAKCRSSAEEHVFKVWRMERNSKFRR